MTLSRAALLVALAAAATLGTALFFEHGLGYVPCKLCLQQREGYHLAIPAAVLASVAAAFALPACAPRGLLAITGLALLSTALLGIYHAGAEWALWAGPTDCGVGAMAAPTDAGSLLGQLERTTAPSCTDAPWRFLGLSFAGWNVVLASAMAAFAFWGAAKASYGGPRKALAT